MMSKLAAWLAGLLLFISVLGLGTFLASDVLLDRPTVRDFLIQQAEEATGWSVHIGSGPHIRWQPWPQLSPQISLEQVEFLIPQHSNQLGPLRWHAEQLRIAPRWKSLLGPHPQPASIQARRITGELPGAAVDQSIAGQHQPQLQFDLAEVQLLLQEATAATNSYPLPRELHIQGDELTWTAQMPNQAPDQNHLQRQSQEISLTNFTLSAGPLSPAGAGRLRAQGLVSGDFAALNAQGTTQMQLQADLAPMTKPGILELTAAQLRLADIRWQTAAGPAVWPGIDWPEIEFSANLRFNQDARSLALNQMQLRMQALTLGGHLKASFAHDAPGASGRVTVEPFDPRAWLHSLGLLTTKLEAPLPDATEQNLRSLAAGFDFQASASDLHAQSLWVKLDDSEAWGQASLHLGEYPSAQFHLSIDQLPLERYLPAGHLVQPNAPPDNSDATTNTSKAIPAAERPPFIGQLTALPSDPTSPPKPVPNQAAVITNPWWTTLNATGDLNIQQLSLFKLNAGAVTIEPTLSDGRLTANFSAPNFYAGHLSGYFELTPVATAATSSRHLTLLTKAEAIQLAPLFKDLQTAMILSGTAALGLELNAQGQDWPAIAQSLSGDLAVLLKEVRFEHLPLTELLAASRIPTQIGINLPAFDAFSEISASFKGEQGRFHSSDCVARAPAMDISGTGLVEVPQQQLDFDLTAVLHDTPDGRGIQELNDLPMPLRIKGDWQAPDIDFDPGPAVRKAAARALDAQLRQHGSDLGRLEERTGIKGLEQGLRQLLGTD
ncbi:AsmA family protein [Rhabdochromatium marinum]|uniref:AsmA family protein n=1 Tax=Rhabdochromatium marinum TaxID=48729 RepID=UPI0019057FD8|nr:AsmA-like C-terminal region-containing protein [Rhabdochromatium marinum]